MRQKFMLWLRFRVCKCKEGTIAPKWLRIFWNILFPLHYFYQRQSGIKYDFRTDVYTIEGMRFTGTIFRILKDGSNKGSKFQLLETDGETATIKRID